MSRFEENVQAIRESLDRRDAEITRLQQQLAQATEALEKAAGLFDEHGDRVPYSLEMDHYAAEAYDMIHRALAELEKGRATQGGT